MSTPIKDQTKNAVMYCVRCRTHVTVSGPENVRFKNDRPALKGTCPHCQTTTYKLISSK